MPLTTLALSRERKSPIGGEPLRSCPCHCAQLLSRASSSRMGVHRQAPVPENPATIAGNTAVAVKSCCRHRSACAITVGILCRRSGHWEHGCDHRNHHRSYHCFSLAVLPCLGSSYGSCMLSSRTVACDIKLLHRHRSCHCSVL
nr:uncharacterized protein LOC112758208 [Arachis hypogaea]